MNVIIVASDNPVTKNNNNFEGALIMKKEKNQNSVLHKRIIGFVVAVVLIALFTIIPPFESLAAAVENPEAAMASIGIFLGAIVLFVCQVAPLAVSTLTLMMLLPYFDIMDLNTIYAQFGGTSFFFVAFCFGVTGALSNTTIPVRISAWITKISKGNAKVLVFGFLFAANIISGFLSNFGTLIMFYGIIISFLKSAGLKPGESRLGKCLMIGMPFACGNGGFISPAGSPGNLIAQSLLLQNGYDMSSLNEVLMATPLSLIICPIVCKVLVVIFKPAALPVVAHQTLMAKTETLALMDAK